MDYFILIDNLNDINNIEKSLIINEGYNILNNKILLFEDVKSSIKLIINKLKEAWKNFLLFLQKTINNIKKFFKKILNKLKSKTNNNKETNNNNNKIITNNKLEKKDKVFNTVVLNNNDIKKYYADFDQVYSFISNNINLYNNISDELNGEAYKIIKDKNFNDLNNISKIKEKSNNYLNELTNEKEKFFLKIKDSSNYKVYSNDETIKNIDIMYNLFNKVNKISLNNNKVTQINLDELKKFESDKNLSESNIKKIYELCDLLKFFLLFSANISSMLFSFIANYSNSTI